MIVASTVLSFLGETQMLSALSLLLLGIGLAPLGRKLLSLSNEAWGQWEPLAGEPPASTVTSRPPGAGPGIIREAAPIRPKCSR